MVKAVEWWRKSAVQGDADAQYKLGMYYESCIGVEKDMSETLNWYNKSANQGQAEEQYHLRIM